MGDSENAQQTSRKRGALKQLSIGDDTEKAKDVDQSVSGVTNIDNAVEGIEETDDHPLKKDKNGDNNGALSSFQQNSSSKNTFTGLAGTEASAPSIFGLPTQDGSTGSGFVFGFGRAKQDVSTETGEENERVTFSAESIMFEFLDGGWKEHGIGVLRVHVSSNGKARLVMRDRRKYALILNASLYPEMKLARMSQKGITFTCVNRVGEGEGLSMFAMKFKDPAIVGEFRAAVEKHTDSKPIKTFTEGHWNPFCIKK